MTPAVRDGSLVGLDGLDADGLVLALRSGVRPPGGIAGRVDWRLGGRLSRLLLDGQLTGSSRELTLVDGAGALGPQRIFLVGVGDARELGPALEHGVRSVHAAGVRRAAFAPLDGLPADEGALAWASAVERSGLEFESWVVLDPDGTLFRSAEAVAAASARLEGRP